MELLYHYLWHHRMLGRSFSDLRGHRIEVIYPGRHNEDAGPDFANARLRIDGREWIGNVEIHVKASDWFRHGHDSDPAYDNVILHVVAIDDTRILRKNNEEIPQITAALPPNFLLTYAALAPDNANPSLTSADSPDRKAIARNLNSARCASRFADIPQLTREDWLETLSVERIHFKAQRLLDYSRKLGGDWEQAVFVMLARGLGFGLNGIPFEMLAMNLPLRIVYHHADNLLQTEALIFGQAGMLDGSNHIFDEYYRRLCVEYGFLARKYGLHPMNVSLWKYARTRPQNFPHRRLAILARALYEGIRFSSSLEEAAGDYEALLRLFSWKAEGYWSNHFDFGRDPSGSDLPLSLSRGSRNLLMINVAAPFYMAHAQLTGDLERGERALDLLRSIPSEKNSIIKSWEQLGLTSPDALRSQALIHLHDEYCVKGQCLQCRFGHFLLRKEAATLSCATGI